MSCAYCYDENISPVISCQLKCNNISCQECLQNMADIAVEDATYPQCHCGAHFNFSETEHILMPCYRKFIERLREPIDIKTTQIETVAIMKKVDWLSSIPVVYKEYIEEFFDAKLTLLCKTQAKQEVHHETVDDIKCPFAYCPGTIVDTRCKICNRILCLTCNLEKFDPHECKPEDIESLNAIQKMIKCPNCKTKIYKIDRCDSMTCAICKTNFSYETGEKTVYGSDFKVYITPKENKISERLKLPEEHRLKLKKLEDVLLKEPQKVTFSKTFIKKYLRFKTSAVIYNNMCLKLENNDDFITVYNDTVEKLKLL